MKASELDRYCGKRWRESFDCADFVEWVQRDLYGRHIRIPNGRPRGDAGPPVLASMAAQFVRPTDTPADGDLVLMFDRGQTNPGHCGLYFFFDHQPQVLHLPERGGSAIHRVSDLPELDLRIQGYYAWA